MWTDYIVFLHVKRWLVVDAVASYAPEAVRFAIGKAFILEGRGVTERLHS